MSHKERLVLRIDPELKERVQEKAQEEDLTLSQLVRRLLRQWLAEESAIPAYKEESGDK